MLQSGGGYHGIQRLVPRLPGQVCHTLEIIGNAQSYRLYRAGCQCPVIKAATHAQTAAAIVKAQQGHQQYIQPVRGLAALVVWLLHAQPVPVKAALLPLASGNTQP